MYIVIFRTLVGRIAYLMDSNTMRLMEFTSEAEAHKFLADANNPRLPYQLIKVEI